MEISKGEARKFSIALRTAALLAMSIKLVLARPGPLTTGSPLAPSHTPTKDQWSLFSQFSDGDVCWVAMVDLKFCKDDIIRSMILPEVQVSPKCCSALDDLNLRCLPKFFPWAPIHLFPHFKAYCDKMNGTKATPPATPTLGAPPPPPAPRQRLGTPPPPSLQAVESPPPPQSEKQEIPPSPPPQALEFPPPPMGGLQTPLPSTETESNSTSPPQTPEAPPSPLLGSPQTPLPSTPDAETPLQISPSQPLETPSSIEVFVSPVSPPKVVGPVSPPPTETDSNSMSPPQTLEAPPSPLLGSHQAPLPATPGAETPLQISQSSPPQNPETPSPIEVFVSPVSPPKVVGFVSPPTTETGSDSTSPPQTLEAPPSPLLGSPQTPLPSAPGAETPLQFSPSSPPQNPETPSPIKVFISPASPPKVVALVSPPTETGSDSTSPPQTLEAPQSPLLGNPQTPLTSIPGAETPLQFSPSSPPQNPETPLPIEVFVGPASPSKVVGLVSPPTTATGTPSPTQLEGPQTPPPTPQTISPVPTQQGTKIPSAAPQFPQSPPPPQEASSLSPDAGFPPIWEKPGSKPPSTAPQVPKTPASSPDGSPLLAPKGRTELPPPTREESSNAPSPLEDLSNPPKAGKAPGAPSLSPKESGGTSAPSPNQSNITPTSPLEQKGGTGGPSSSPIIKSAPPEGRGRTPPVASGRGPESSPSPIVKDIRPPSITPQGSAGTSPTPSGEASKSSQSPTGQGSATPPPTTGGEVSSPPPKHC